MSKDNRKILVAWAAGFFEGEGHVNVQLRKGKSFFALSVAQVYRSPLDRMCELFGGKVYGPYGPYSTNKQPYYQWTAYTNDAFKALDEMFPYLLRKGGQAEEKLQMWKEHHAEK